MQKIKFDSWLTLLIVLVLVAVFYAFHKYYEDVKSRVEELKSEIKSSLLQLDIEIERQEILFKEAVKIYKLITTLLCALLFSSIALAIYLGITYNEALENVVGTAGLLLAMVTVIFYQTFNPDVLLKKLKDKVYLREMDLILRL